MRKPLEFEILDKKEGQKSRKARDFKIRFITWNSFENS